MGLPFDRNSESFLVGNQDAFYGWLEYVAGIKPPYNRDDDRTPEPEPKPETPVAAPRDPRRRHFVPPPIKRLRIAAPHPRAMARSRSDRQEESVVKDEDQHEERVNDRYI